jgi:hypothetical protein
VYVGRVDSPRRATLPTHTRTAAWVVRELEQQAPEEDLRRGFELEFTDRTPVD